MSKNKDEISQFQTISNIIKKSKNKFDISNIFHELLFCIKMLYPDEYPIHLHRLTTLICELEHYIINKEQVGAISIGLGGGFSAGKSRFVNSLLGINALPEDIGATTAVATEVNYGSKEYFNVQNVFDNIISINKQQMSNLRHSVDKSHYIELNKIIKKIYYFSPNLQWKNISFLDTPGHSKADNHQDISDEQIALQALGQADYILWSVSADNGTIREDDIAFLQKLESEQPKYIIITKSDLRNAKDIPNIAKSIKDNLEKNGIAYQGITAWSAPISKDKGTEVYGDSVIQWLNNINKTTKSDVFLELFNYIEKLQELLKDKKNYLKSSIEDKESIYRKIGLKDKSDSDKIKAIDKTLKDNSFYVEEMYFRTANYYDNLGEKELASRYFFKIIHDYDVINWLFSNAKRNKKIGKNLKLSILDLTNKSANGKDFRACHSLIYIYEKFLNGPDYFDNLALQKNISAKYHKNEESLEWLFENAAEHRSIRDFLSDILDLENANNKALRYLNIEYRVGDIKKATDNIFNFAEQNHKESVQWLLDESKNNSSLLCPLGEFYLKNNSLKDANIALELFCKSAKIGNKHAINGLYQVVYDFNEIKYIQTIIDIYNEIPLSLKSDIFFVYRKLVYNDFIYYDGQKNQLLIMFHDYIFDYNNISVLKDFVKVVNKIELPMGYFLLANIYMYHETFQDFDEAYKNYSIISNRDVRALYNKSVLTYYGYGTKKSKLKFVYLLLKNRNKQFFKESCVYLFRQIIGFKQPSLVDVDDDYPDFENYYIKPTFVLLFYMVISSATLYGSYHIYEYYKQNFGNEIYAEEHVDSYNETAEYKIGHNTEDNNSIHNHDVIDEQEDILSKQLSEAGASLFGYEEQLNTLISNLPKNMQEELLSYDWEFQWQEICHQESNKSNENYDIAYLNCKIRMIKLKIRQIEELSRNLTQQEQSKQNDELKRQNEHEKALIEANTMLEAKKKEFNQLWNTLPKSIQELLTQDQKKWVEDRNEFCSHASSEVDANQELFYTRCVTSKLDERLSFLKQYISEKKEVMIEFDKAKNNLDSTKKKFNKFWNSMPVSIQNDLQQGQVEWLKQRDSICAKKSSQDKSTDPAIVEIKCVNDLLNKRLVELNNILKETKDPKSEEEVALADGNENNLSD